MIETWVLILWLASGEVAIQPTLGELACDTERRAVIAAADQVCIAEGSRYPVAAQCLPSTVLTPLDAAPHGAEPSMQSMAPPMTPGRLAPEPPAAADQSEGAE